MAIDHTKPFLVGEDFVKEFENDYPEAYAWHQRLSERPAVSKAKEDRSKAIAGDKH